MERQELKRFVSVADALDILGPAKVITREQALRAWYATELEADPPLKYGEVVLRCCAEDNRQGQTDWRLVRIIGFSLAELYEVSQTYFLSGQPRFGPNRWWLSQDEKSWAGAFPGHGYYLVDFGPRSDGRWGGVPWAEQSSNICRLGTVYERAHEAMVCEAVVSFAATHGEQLLASWCHWGRSVTAAGQRVCVGYNPRDGVVVSHASDHRSDLRV